MYLHAKTNFILYLRLRSRSKLRRLTLMCVSFSSTVRALTGRSWRSTHRRWSIFLCWTSRCQTLGRATSSLALKWDLSVSKDKHKHTENNTCKHSHAHTHMHLERHYYDKPTCPVICKLTCKWYKSHIPTQTHTLVYAEAVVRHTHSLSCTAGESDIPQQVKDDQKEKRRKVRKTCEEEETSTGSVTVRKKPGGRQQQEADLRWRASRQPEAWHPWLQPPLSLLSSPRWHSFHSHSSFLLYLPLSILTKSVTVSFCFYVHTAGSMTDVLLPDDESFQLFLPLDIKSFKPKLWSQAKVCEYSED